MNWRNRLSLLLGAASPFAISSAVHASPATVLAHTLDKPEPTADRELAYWDDPANRDHLLQLAGHSSHSSHASHSSHYSGSSGRSSEPIYVPAPSPPPPPPPRYPPRPTRPAPSTNTTGGTAPSAVRPFVSSAGTGSTAPAPGATPMSQSDIKTFVQKVQVALILGGYDPGPVDGNLGGKTQAALKAYQEANGLNATGFMDRDTLELLGVLK